MSFVGTGNNSFHWSKQSAIKFLKEAKWSELELKKLTGRQLIKLASMTSSWNIEGWKLPIKSKLLKFIKL
jgi:hypothetical protein